MGNAGRLSDRRRGFWLRMARERAGLKQDDVAQQVGYSANSASTVNLWEEGERPVRARELEQLARIYGVPVKVFMSPEATALERLDDLVLAAKALEREDWEAEGLRDPGTGDGRGDEPGTPLR